MAHGNTPKVSHAPTPSAITPSADLEQQVLLEKRRQAALEAALGSAQPTLARTPQQAPEICLNKEIQPTLGVHPTLSQDRHFELDLSSKLSEYREALGSPHPAVKGAQMAKAKLLEAVAAIDAELEREATAARLGQSISTNGASPSTKSVISDPLGFLADLIKKLEELLIGKLEGRDQEIDPLLDPTKQQKMKVKRKKKGQGLKGSITKESSRTGESATSEAPKKTGFYHLDEAQAEEELVDLEQALREAADAASKN